MLPKLLEMINRAGMALQCMELYQDPDIHQYYKSRYECEMVAINEVKRIIEKVAV